MEKYSSREWMVSLSVEFSMSKDIIWGIFYIVGTWSFQM